MPRRHLRANSEPPTSWVIFRGRHVSDTGCSGTAGVVAVGVANPGETAHRSTVGKGGSNFDVAEPPDAEN